jgi:alkylhydroperoxidase family enzyme
VFDYRECDFDAADTALCDYAVQLTLNPGGVGQLEIESLREVRWSDEQITIAVQVIGYFNYINRIADGLGVDLEDWMILDIDDWKRKKPNWRSV